jgi:hypothetical protein
LIRHILPKISPPLGGRGFTLLNVNYLKGVILNLFTSTCTMVITQSPLFNRVKGRGNQRVFILSTPTLALPHRRGRGLLGRFEISFVNHYRLYNYGLISNYGVNLHERSNVVNKGV